jgi:ABC-type transport system involved in cytochrome bd biosynthesis fused ATPase/permease subunit
MSFSSQRPKFMFVSGRKPNLFTLVLGAAVLLLLLTVGIGFFLLLLTVAVIAIPIFWWRKRKLISALQQAYQQAQQQAAEAHSAMGDGMGDAKADGKGRTYDAEQGSWHAQSDVVMIEVSAEPERAARAKQADDAVIIDVSPSQKNVG